MLIKEVYPIGNAAVNLIDEETDDLIDQIVELPLREACKILKKKGIETVMSSANKTNILKPGVKPIEKEDVYGSIERKFETHTFLEAGVGYAWLMVSFSTLSDENKDLLFELESKLKDGEKLIWFVYPVDLSGNIEHALRIGKYSYDELKLMLGESEIPKGIEGASVCWYGIGEVDGENQPKLKEKEKIILIEIWTEVLKQAGVTEIEFKECAVTEENNKFETTVTSIFPPNSIGQFISTPDFGGFNPGESTFADEEKAKLEFEAFSKKIKISGEPILIVGTTANDGVDEGIEKELSLKRANTVKTLLINFGVDSNDIMTVGAGNDPIWLDGSQLDIAQQHDRSVRIVSANSNEAIELLEKYG